MSVCFIFRYTSFILFLFSIHEADFVVSKPLSVESLLFLQKYFFAKKILHLNHSQKSRGNKRKLFSSFFVKYIIDFRVREKIKGFALVAIRAVTEKFCCVVLCAKSVRA